LKSCLFIRPASGPKKAKEYISHGFAEATEQGNKTFSGKIKQENAKIFYIFSCPACEFGGQLKLNSSATPGFGRFFSF